MMRRELRFACFFVCAAFFGACGNRVTPADGSDVATDGITADRNVGDSIRPDVTGQPDVPEPIDTIIPPTDDGIPPGPDDGLPDVVVTMDDGLADAGIIEDVPPAPDAPPADVVITDSGPACPGGLSDMCPAAPPGPCPNLSDGVAHTAVFTGLTTGIPASCEGAMSGAGPDGIMPLTITTPSDVVITATPTGGDLAVIALFSPTGCGTAAGEMRCSNPGAGNVATVRALSLAPGTYWLSVATVRGSVTIVQAMITTPRPRLAGDVCPGVAVMPDGAPATLSTAMFSTDNDYGTTCAGSGTTGNVDGVFSYTLSAPRDVTINISATGTGSIRADVAPVCGMRAMSIPACATGNPARRFIRAQPAGTYYITVDYTGAPGRTFVAQVTTAAPTMPPAGDRCPGVALTAGVVSNVDASMLSPDYALTCAAGVRDAVFSFVAPAATSDVLVNVTAPAGANAALQLQSTCGTTNVGPCVSSTQRSVWQRYRGLTPGATESVIAGSNAMTGMLGARYQVVPAATPMAVTTNDLCTAATAITEAGGVFTGNTMGFADNTTLPGSCPGACRGGVDAVYRLTLTAPRRVVMSTLGSAFDTVLFIRPGTMCNVAVAGEVCNDDYYGNASAIDVMLNAGTYWVIVSGCGATARGAYQLDVATF